MSRDQNETKYILKAISGGFRNLAVNKKDSQTKFINTYDKLMDITLGMIGNETVETSADVIHNNICELLDDTEGIIHPPNILLSSTEIFASFIELFTPYFIEVSSIVDDDGQIFFQIDEKDNKFYFTFFEDRLEFAFGNFNEYKSFRWCEDENSILSMMKELGMPDDLIGSWILAYKYVCYPICEHYNICN